MKNIVLISISIWLFCSSEIHCLNNGQFNPCSIIQLVLDHQDVQLFTGLDKAENILPGIRFSDLTGQFNNCSSLYKKGNNDFVIPYHFVDAIKPSLNTGLYRDIVIHELSFSPESKFGNIILSIANFETHNNVNTNFRIVLHFSILEKEQIEITESIITEYIDYPPPSSYERQN